MMLKKVRVFMKKKSAHTSTSVKVKNGCHKAFELCSFRKILTSDFSDDKIQKKNRMNI
jgi:hypothetical protein